jgi:D-amino-acid oxidase
MRVTVLGAGVSGLTCGVRLLEAGATAVTLVARDLPGQTTSAVAGAVWFPYRVAPNERTGPWAEASYQRFAALIDQGGAPVSMVESTMLYPEPLAEEPWWLGAVPGERVRASRPDELPEGYADGRAVQVPCIEAPAYLDWLARRFADLGGRLDQAAVTRLDDLPGDAVVDCAGTGATALAGDDTLKPVRGQVAYVRTHAALRFMVDETGPNALAYVLPRPDVVVLGGTAEEDDAELAPREVTTHDILARTQRLQPELQGATLVGAAVGLRPARPAVRLEADTTADGRPLVHDYGHGGSGFTLSWGCADEVAELLLGAV